MNAMVPLRTHQIEDYERFVGAETVDRVRTKIEPL
jgi:hypothetical protein